MKIEQKQSELAKEKKNKLLYLGAGSILLAGNLLQSRACHFKCVSSHNPVLSR